MFPPPISVLVLSADCATATGSSSPTSATSTTPTIPRSSKTVILSQGPRRPRMVLWYRPALRKVTRWASRPPRTRYSTCRDHCRLDGLRGGRKTRRPRPATEQGYSSDEDQMPRISLTLFSVGMKWLGTSDKHAGFNIWAGTAAGNSTAGSSRRGCCEISCVGLSVRYQSTLF